MAVKPMLAGTPETLETLKYPVLASPKYDGIRCLVIDGVPMSRKLLPIPNRHIARLIKESGINGLDGELVVPGKDGKLGTFQATTSAVMSEDGEPKFEYHVFDTFLRPSVPFADRIKAVEKIVKLARLPWLKFVTHATIIDAPELIRYEQYQVEERGFEGVMLRTMSGPYKFGRSSGGDSWSLLKVKRWTTEEAVVTGAEEQETNLNEAQKDALGHTKRSSAKAGKMGAGVLGTLVGQSEKWGVIRAGSGFNAAQRASLWKEREKLPGRIFTFKYVKAGVKDAPRFPIFVGFRDRRDMS